MAGAYLHIPYCRKACSYCDFHFSTSRAGLPAMVEAMCEEIVLRRDYLASRELHSIYFGGGTPSLLEESQLRELMAALQEIYKWKQEAEITLEANPDDISITALRAWRSVGINRLSIGLQSFNEEELRWMNRAHNARQSLDSVRLAQDEGFDNISVDLIYGSRFQDLWQWEQTLRKVTALGVPHISAYNLTIEKHTALGVARARGDEPAVDEELSSRQFEMMTDILSDAGFHHYEISNFAMPGKEAVHNSSYWRQQPYIGIGPSAHSYNGGSRQWNVKSNARYITALKNGEPFFEFEHLSEADRFNEYVLTRLRTSWGADINEIAAAFGPAVADHFADVAARRNHLFSIDNGKYVLTGKARLLADGVASDFFL